MPTIQQQAKTIFDAIRCSEGFRCPPEDLYPCWLVGLVRENILNEGGVGVKQYRKFVDILFAELEIHGSNPIPDFNIEDAKWFYDILTAMRALEVKESCTAFEFISEQRLPYPYDMKLRDLERLVSNEKKLREVETNPYQLPCDTIPDLSPWQKIRFSMLPTPSFMDKACQLFTAHKTTYCFTGAALLTLALTAPFGVALLSQTALSSVFGTTIAAAVSTIESYTCTNLIAALAVGTAALTVERAVNYLNNRAI